MMVILDEIKHGQTVQTPFGINELIYADDTLLLGGNNSAMQSFMEHIGRAGRSAGLSFNWARFQALATLTSAVFWQPERKAVPIRGSIVYLGSARASEGRINAELGRRIGLAKADSRNLQPVWAHSTVCSASKI